MGTGLACRGPVGAGLDGPGLIGLGPIGKFPTCPDIGRAETNAPVTRGELEAPESGAARN